MDQLPDEADLERRIAGAWRAHADDPAAVAEQLAALSAQVVRGRKLAAWTAVVVHVHGEHLGRWQKGISLLAPLLSASAGADAAERAALMRALAVLHLGAGQEPEAEELMRAAGGDRGTQVQVFASAAAALAGQRRLEESSRLFQRALAAAESATAPLPMPSARALAITANNLACELEERRRRSPGETALMLAAASAARRWWEIAGGWQEVERADYRLAMSHVAAGDGAGGRRHALACVAGCAANQAKPFEHFYAHQALALCAHACGDAAAAAAARERCAALIPTMIPEVQDGCRDELRQLDARLAAGPSAPA
jgi:hypothetical protein